MPWDPEKETREVPLDLKEGTQEAPSDPVEETREAASDREDEAQGTPSYPEEETLHGSIHGLGFRSLPGQKTIGFGCGVDSGGGGDHLALKDARSDSIGYLGGRVRCLIRGGKGSYIFETGVGVHGTADEGRCSECVRR